MNEILSALLAGVLIYVLGQIASRFFLDPLSEFREVRSRVALTLPLYADLLSNPDQDGLERRREASRELWSLAIELAAKWEVIPLRDAWSALRLIPDRSDIVEAKRCIVGLSRGLWDPKAGGFNRASTVTALEAMGFSSLEELEWAPPMTD